MTREIKHHPDNTVELILTISWQDVKNTYDAVVDDFVANSELPGFRKGKAPRTAVEEKLDKSKIYEKVLERLLPKAYAQAIKEEGLHPVVMPKVTLLEAKENNPWKIQAVTCEKPEITLGAYKQAIGEIKSQKKNKIWVPGQGENKKEEDKEKKVMIEEILDAVYKSVETVIPSILTEQEINRLLSDLIDQTKKLGLTVEQYLASTNRTTEGIRHEYGEQAKKTLTLEFALETIADKEGIFVSDDDINKVIQSAKTDEEKKTMEQERYYLASILRRQKTIDALANL